MIHSDGRVYSKALVSATPAIAMKPNEECHPAPSFKGNMNDPFDFTSYESASEVFTYKCEPFCEAKRRFLCVESSYCSKKLPHLPTSSQVSPASLETKKHLTPRDYKMTFIPKQCEKRH